MTLILALQDGLFMIAFDKPWAAVEWAVTLQMAMLRYALLLLAVTAWQCSLHCARTVGERCHIYYAGNQSNEHDVCCLLLVVTTEARSLF